MTISRSRHLALEISSKEEFNSETGTDSLWQKQEDSMECSQVHMTFQQIMAFQQVNERTQSGSQLGLHR